MSADVDTAQDFLDCVSGEYGQWWQDRANEFIEDHQDIGDIQVWALWDLIRTTEVSS